MTTEDKFSHPVPPSLADRPTDSRGYPIPHGVWRNPETGDHDFRVLDHELRIQALEQKVCAVSGKPMPEGEYWFVGGPGNFRSRVFVDGPMLLEVAEFSLRTCPHLALSAAQFRKAGLDGLFKPAGASDKKPELFMLGLAASYEMQEKDDFIYAVAGPWRMVSWWQNGRRLKKDEAIELLARVAPDIVMPGANPER